MPADEHSLKSTYHHLINNYKKYLFWHWYIYLKNLKTWLITSLTMTNLKIIDKYYGFSPCKWPIIMAFTKSISSFLAENNKTTCVETSSFVIIHERIKSNKNPNGKYICTSNRTKMSYFNIKQIISPFFLWKLIVLIVILIWIFPQNLFFHTHLIF